MTKDDNNGTNWCYVNIKSRGIPCQKTGAADYHAQLRLPDKGCVIKAFIVCNS